MAEIEGGRRVVVEAELVRRVRLEVPARPGETDEQAVRRAVASSEEGLRLLAASLSGVAEARTHHYALRTVEILQAKWSDYRAHVDHVALERARAHPGALEDRAWTTEETYELWAHCEGCGRALLCDLDQPGEDYFSDDEGCYTCRACLGPDAPPKAGP